MTVTKPPSTSITSATQPPPVGDRAQVLVVVEGTTDIEFLRRIARMLHAHDASLPHLADMEQRGALVFIPFGGGHVAAWSERLAPLGIPEFHLYDHELPPETDARREAAKIVNARAGCRAALTRKRSLENYLHPHALAAAGGVDVAFDDFDSVAEITARQVWQQSPEEPAWELLPRRSRKRRAHRAKRWLTTRAAEEMTAELLRERDPAGEVVSWLTAVNNLAGRC